MKMSKSKFYKISVLHKFGIKSVSELVKITVKNYYEKKRKRGLTKKKKRFKIYKSPKRRNGLVA